MQDFIKEYLEYIVAAIIAILSAGGVIFKLRKSKKVSMKNITTKSGDVVAGNKTTYKNDKKD